MTREQAIQLYETKWWEGKSNEDIVMFQLFEDEMRTCMPFVLFHKAVEYCLKRPVYRYEFSLNLEGLRKEFLGDRKAPTFKEIVNLIPMDKRVIIL